MKQSLFDLADLESFVHVVEHESFTAAARAMGTSKVALSRAVAALEASLDERLLTRSTRSLHTTAAGELVLARAPELLERAHGLVQAIAAGARDPSGRLRIATAQILHDVVLEAVVLPFARRYPKVTLELELFNDTAPLAGAFDLALLVGPPPDSTLGSLLIGRARLGCFASAAYLAKAGAPATPAELASHAIIAVGAAQASATWTFVKGGRTSPVTIRPRLRVASHDFALRAAARAAGVARLPLFLVARSAQAGDLVRVLPGWSIPEAPAYAVFPNRERPSVLVRAFLDLLKERLGRPRR